MPADTDTDPDRRWTTITVEPEVRDRLRALKRGQQSYNELLDQMVDQYDPDSG